MLQHSKEPSLIVLLLLVSFAAVLAMLFTPALPEIAYVLAISPSEAQLTISVFLIGYALGTLPYGPLSNRFGRKIALYIGTSISAAACLLVIIAGNFSIFWLFIVGRFFMGFGGSAGLKVAFTIVGDVYKNEQATKKISALVLSFAVMPSLAIALGGFLTQQFGWESCFYFLACYSLFILFLGSLLPETSKDIDREALHIKKIAQGYLRKFKNRKLVLGGLMMGCGASVIYLFSAMAPFIGIEIIGLSPESYGVLNFIPPVGIIIGSSITRYLAGKKEQIEVMKIGTIVAFIFTILMLVLFWNGLINQWTLFLPMPFIFIGTSIAYSNASALAMLHMQDKSNGSAVMHFLNLGLCVVTLFCVEALPFHQPYIMPFVFVIISLVMFGLLYLFTSDFRKGMLCQTKFP